MTQPETQLDLLIVDEEADAEQLDELTVRLMRDLRELGAESVDCPAGVNSFYRIKSRRLRSEFQRRK